MEESNELKKLYGFFQSIIYFSIVLECAIFILHGIGVFPSFIENMISRLGTIGIYADIFYSKLATLFLILIVSVGTKSKKDVELNPTKQIVIPLLLGFTIFFGSTFFYFNKSKILVYHNLHLFNCFYILCSFVGAILIHISLDSISKMIKSGLMKDKFNTENESFQQSTKLVENEYSINIPIKFYYNGKVHDGWLNIDNPFRGTLVIGTPGSGKTFGVIIPFIKQHLKKGFSALIYDFKFPDLGKVAYYHYLINKRNGALKNHKFHVVNLNEVEKSRRINPLRPDYIRTLADASETAEALLQALRKVESSGGSDQFFTQSAVNFLSAVIYFFARFENGKYSTLPHVLAFTNRTYEEMFRTLFTDPELESLLSPFKSAFDKKAYDQLEGQLGTLKINISRLATKETFWVFSGDDFNLKISDLCEPSILVLANDPDTQSINSACYSVVLNRITKLVNKKGNLPSSLIVDELPTLYMHKIENLIATARSNKVAILMGLQELPQFRQNYGKDTADTICSVTANVIAGAVRNKDTLEWLEKLFGRVRQKKMGLSIDRTKTSVNMNEEMGNLIPASKIANQKAGEIVAQIATDAEYFDGQHRSSTYKCKINISQKDELIESKEYIDLPIFYNFGTNENRDIILRNNLLRIKNDIEIIINSI